MKYLTLFILCFSCIHLYAQHDVPVTAGFEVVGVVKKELKFGISDIGRLKQDTIGDVVIKNHKGEQKNIAKQLKGVLLRTIIDSAGIMADKPKDYNELVIVLIASDGYRNVYSWNELFNTDIGNHVYIITEMDGKTIDQMTGRILVLSLSDLSSGRRHLKGLARIEVKKI